MKNKLSLLVISCIIAISVSAQGLRHSICVVKPEYSATQKSLFADYALYTARAGLRTASQALTAYKSDLFGSGVVTTIADKKYVLTNSHVVGYAREATIIFQLHDKTLTYANCPIISAHPSIDLALIELPTECEMIPLPMYSKGIDDGIQIIAAGFPELIGQPSWQMTQGIVSNAHVQFNNSQAIQHTASIDPGSSGGPLLIKEDGKYHILGINTWKASYREGVGFAIGEKDVNNFLENITTLPSEAHKDLERIQSLSGEGWIYIFHHIPDSMQYQIKGKDWHLPLDQVLSTIDIRDSLVQSGVTKTSHYDNSHPRITTNLNHKAHVRLMYDNYFGINQQVSVQAGYDWAGFFSTGVQVSAIILDCMTEDPTFGTKLGYANRVGAMFGIYLGGVIPISIGKYIIAPRITQSAGGGPLKTGKIDGEYAIIADTRVGLDWRVPFSSCDLVLGVNYDMNWLWTKNTLKITAYKYNSNSFNQYLQHGIGMSIGVAW